MCRTSSNPPPPLIPVHPWTRMLLAARPTQWPASRYKHKTTRRGAQLGCTFCTEQSTAQRDMANFDAGDWLLCEVWFAETVAALNPEELERMILDAQNAAAELGNLTTCLCCDAQCKFNPCSDCSTAATPPTNNVCFVLPQPPILFLDFLKPQGVYTSGGINHRPLLNIWKSSFPQAPVYLSYTLDF